MAADITRLQGQVIEDLSAESSERDVQSLIAGLLRALLEEQEIGRQDARIAI